MGHEMVRWMLLLLLMMMMVLDLLVQPSTAQQTDNCPDTFFEYGSHCYDFVSQPAETFQEAIIFCQRDFADLVSINSVGEHNFIQNWLMKFDTQRRQWFTSGYREKSGKLIWDSDGSDITTDFFPSEAERNRVLIDPKTNIQFNQIVYKYSPTLNEYRWGWSRLMKTGPFICEISKQDTWKIYQQKRDFSFGTGITDPNLWETGPNITFQSGNTVFYESRGAMTTVVLDCQATGNPRPTYQWYRKSASQSTRQYITSDLSPRYTVTNGRLTIDDPDQIIDVSVYTCVATNKLGTVMSNPVEVTHGYIGQFPNVKTSVIDATMYMGKEIACQPPNHNTDLRYNWFKQNVFNFIRPELNPQYFLSKNGKLYISEVQAADQDEYFCMVFMAPKSGQTLTGTQPPSRTSMGIDVRVVGENANTYGPDIQDKFPQYFPLVPMVGDVVEIECLAYGRLPLYYSWLREDGSLHPEAYYRDHNRVLIIPKARLEDTGSYTCMVKGERNSANKTVHLSLKAIPSFPFPLQNQHLDKGSSFTWSCNAIGVPKPVYTWFKNGKMLTVNSGDGISVYRNILSIDNLDSAKHDGMYQCEASNSYGLARSSAQLRVLYFAPTFATNPVDNTKQAAEGGNVTIACKPQAAPRATIRWLKNGVEVGKVLPNGALELSFLSQADSGTYTCVATNELGEAQSSCVLHVQGGTVFTEFPADIELVQNETGSLPCKASFDRSKTDIVYSWQFNDHVIDFSTDSEDSATYSMPYAQTRESGMLYIISAQFKHEGQYTCFVSTVTGSISHFAYVTVRGPPGEPGGVHIRQAGRQEFQFGNLELWWQEGLKHGYPVTMYAIEYQSIYEDHWRLLKEDIPELETHIENFPDWRGYFIKKGLSPGTAYRFRVRAGNHQVGYGPASAGPYKWYTMAAAAPIFSPTNIGGGGGSVGQLRITWDPMPRSIWGGPNLRYIVHFRQKDVREINGKWASSEEMKKTTFYYLVGRERYYTEYEVKVQAINNMGRGPNSTVAIVYSAEDMPSIAPTFVQANAVNGTAGIVEWEAIPNNRETAKGKVVAYQVNYWEEGDTRCPGKFEDQALFIRFYGHDVTSGQLVGMNPGGDYCVNLQFINGAGLGPKTDNYYLGMNDAPPGRYPEYVTVMSHGNDSVRVLFRGVSTIFGEDPLRGYKAWWWDIREDIRAAKETDFGKAATGVIHGIEKDIVYKLRVLAYSNGGDGKKSPDLYFTLGGLVMFDPVTTEIMNSAPSQRTFSSWSSSLWIAGLLTYLVTRTLHS